MRIEMWQDNEFVCEEPCADLERVKDALDEKRYRYVVAEKEDHVEIHVIGRF